MSDLNDLDILMKTVEDPKTLRKDIPKIASEQGYSLGKNKIPNYTPMATDLAQEYIIALVKDRKKNNPSDNFAVTQGVAYDPNVPPEDKNSLQYIAVQLAKTYYKILQKFGDSGAIYTVMNARSTMKENVNHQNWLCLDVTSKKLIRFEPSNEYPEFMFPTFCETVVGILSELTKVPFTYEKVNNTVINVFDSCRAFSTMLAVMHIKGIDFNNIKNFYARKKINASVAMPFVFLLDRYLNQLKESCSTPTQIPPSRTRSKTEYNYVII